MRQECARRSCSKGLHAKAMCGQVLQGGNRMCNTVPRSPIVSLDMKT